MTDGIQLNGPTLAMLGSIAGVLGGVIWTLFQLVKGRMERAEKQVDTLIPAGTEMVGLIRGIKDDLKDVREEHSKLSELVRAIQAELTRDAGRRA